MEEPPCGAAPGCHRAFQAGAFSSGGGIGRRLVGFFAAASCGQCPPCKVGTYQVARLLERIEAGNGRPDDLAALRNLSALLPGSGRCGLVDGAATVLASSLETFAAEYEAAVR